MKESKIERYMRTEIAKLGGWMEKHTSPGTKGPPDDIVMWPIGTFGCEVPCDRCGRFRDWPTSEFIETKAPGGKLSVLQQRDHKRRRAMGFQVHVIWTMDRAEAYLASRGKR